VSVLGYWGDIIVTPYIAFGVESCEESLFEFRERQYVRTCVYIAEFNLKALLLELQTGKTYRLEEHELLDEQHEAKDEKKQQQQTTTATIELIEEEEEEEEEAENEDDNDADAKEAKDKAAAAAAAEQASRWAQHTKIVLLPRALETRVIGKSKYAQRFDRVYLGASHVHHMKPELNAILKPNAVIIAETMAYVPLDEEQKVQYRAALKTMRTKAGWQLCCDTVPAHEFHSQSLREARFSATDDGKVAAKKVPPTVHARHVSFRFAPASSSTSSGSSTSAEAKTTM
jgi:dynein assembly factor 3